MTQTAYQEIEGVVVNTSNTELKIALDKILVNDSAGEANGQFVCSGVETLNIDGSHWQLTGNTAMMDSGLKDTYEASNIDTSNLNGYTFANSTGDEVTIWSDCDEDQITIADPNEIA